MRGKILTAVLATSAIVATPRAHANNSIGFAKGALILPTSASFQDDCGSVAVYGLVYNVLRANAWLDKNGYTHVTLYYGYYDSKKSPNRCVPTDTTTAPTGSATWNDGCDFTVPLATGKPVTLVTNTSASSAAADTAVVTYDTTSRANVSPQYPSKTVDAGVKLVGYLGGPFLVNDKDAPTFLKLLDGTLVAKDANNNAIDFSPFRKAAACSLGSAWHVNVHRAQTAFTANVGQAFISPPPRLALLATDVKGAEVMISDGILEQYLTNAGLTFTGSVGCPPNGININTPAICPNKGAQGQIYDLFDFQDLVTNELAEKDGLGNPLYAMLWTPHWETRSAGGKANTANETTALANISKFLDGQAGLSAECASISSYEGDYDPGSADLVDGLPLQTCKDNGGGACAGTQPYGLSKGGSGPGQLPNCTDVTVSNGSACAYFSYPGDPYAQTADYLWNGVYGHTALYIPRSGGQSIYQPGVKPLISYVSSLNKANLTDNTTARAMINYDLSSRSIKDNTPGKSNILYLAGHDQSGEIAGTKIMLETLLQLGNSSIIPPTSTFEVSRASPIVAFFGATAAIVQGTFEYVTPAPPVPVVNAAADLAGFTFPYIAGHVRARVATSLTTTASAYNTGTILFDVGGEVPPVDNAGCGSPFGGSCRTVFTAVATTAGGVTRYKTTDRLLWQDGNVGTIGPLISPAGFTAAQQQTLLERILAGRSDSKGGFLPVIGGVDRSTVAVIGTSGFAGKARNTMIYFGGTDGMLHAACGSVGGPCDLLGRELWAYVPRTQLPFLRLNTARIDGSVRVVDAYGDWDGTGTKRFATILTFQTGSGDVTLAGGTPAVYAIEVTDPTNPVPLWEYTIATPATRGVYELGQGLTLSMGPTLIGGSSTNVVYAETNNGGNPNTAGVVVTAINADTGASIWQTGYIYPPPHKAGDASVPATGIPGGAVNIDKTSSGLVTDLVYADLYGNLWEVDPATGLSRYPVKLPLFQFSTDYHPIGAVPTIYSNGNTQFAVVVSGGYADPLDSSWAGSPVAQQYVAAVSLNTPAANVTLSEASGAPNVPFVLSLGAGEKGYAQAIVIGNQVYVTTDTADVNATGYGAGGNTGHVFAYDVSKGTQTAPIVIAGGAGSIANNDTAVYASNAGGQQVLGTAASGTAGPKVDSTNVVKMLRKLWLRTQ